MTSPLIALSPASGSQVGGGHLMRCLALAMALEALGARTVFVVEEAGAALLRRFAPRFPTVVAYESAARRLAIEGLHPAAAVIDDYTVDAGFECAIGGAPVVMVIDDLADRAHAARLLLDTGYGRQKDDYAVLAPEAQLLIGPDYALLRPGFERRQAPVSPEISRLFVSFGLSDVGGVTARAVSRLLKLAPLAALDVALAENAESLPVLKRLAKSEPRLVLHIDADTAPLMRAADAGIGAGGAMTWERRAIGLPSLAVIVAENQRPGIEALARDEVVLAVDFASPSFDADFDGAFARLADPGVRRAMVDNPRASCDGHGAGRVADALLALIVERP